MKSRKFVLLVALVVTVLISSRREAHAGGPINVTGTSTSLKGTVKFQGTVPAAKPINMSADPSCAKQHSSPAMSQEILADAKGDLQNVVVFVSEGLGDRTFDPPSQPAVIEQKGCMYAPHVLAVRANQQLEVVNSDPTLHNIHPLPANNREWNKAEGPGATAEESFSREEIAIPIKCNVHPWMRSYIAVFKHPYFAVTGKDGSFDLGSLPPGNYTIKAWHEKLGTSTQQVTIGAHETKSLEFVFKSM
ncbi:MAG TPA: carboxypeptidase regulatory-like domain-containing protein [Terriglobales bacterium]|nr:carboxypeptidase regulatory-like domain-containing protein [Terriglobales bacterium]